jgi:pimeloyl-ACP methyl ester carboxylesterase
MPLTSFLRAVVLVAALFASGIAHAAALALTAADGTAIKAVDYGKGTNGVILVHDKDRSGADWQLFAQKLAANGFHVVAVDLRGHGASKPPDALTEADWPKMTQDVEAAVAWLHAKGATKLAVVGASFGANLAVNAAADDAAVTNLVLLSPGLNLNGVTTSAAMEKYGKRPVLFVASNDDAYAVRSVNALDAKATGQKKIALLDQAGAGVKMLNRDPGLEATLLGWLNGADFVQSGVAGQQQVNTGVDSSTIQTTGTKFGQDDGTPKAPVDLDDPQ